MKKSYGTAKKSAGIEDFTWHDMRDTFASWLVKAGVPLDRVRDLLVHSSIAETERYAHLAPAALLEAVAYLPELTKKGGKSSSALLIIETKECGH